MSRFLWTPPKPEDLIWIPPTVNRWQLRTGGRDPGDAMWAGIVKRAGFEARSFSRLFWTIDHVDYSRVRIAPMSKELSKRAARNGMMDMGGVRKQVESARLATLVSSLRADGSHAITLDIDHPAELIESSTPGHYHLYINVPMEWWRYKLLLRVLAFCGVLEWGYVKASITKGATFLRLPWKKKGVLS